MSRTRLAVLIPAVALALLACGGPPLATVGDAQLTMEDLASYNPANRDGSATAADFRADLRSLILLTAVAEAASAGYGVSVSDSDVEAFVANPPAAEASFVAAWQAEIDQGSATRGEMIANLRSYLIRNEVMRVRASADDVAALFAESPELFYSACIRHIFVETEQEAADAIGRIEAGEDFDAVAADVSLDTSEGGRIVDPTTGRCDVPLSALAANFPMYVAGIMAADVGELTGPIQSEVGWHAVIVESKTGPASEEELRADYQTYLTPEVLGQLSASWLTEVFTDVAVDVDPAIGAWSPDDGTIDPPG